MLAGKLAVRPAECDDVDATIALRDATLTGVVVRSVVVPGIRYWSAPASMAAMIWLVTRS